MQKDLNMNIPSSFNHNSKKKKKKTRNNPNVQCPSTDKWIKYCATDIFMATFTAEREEELKSLLKVKE